MGYRGRVAIRVVVTALGCYLLVIGWITSHPPLAALPSKFGAVPGGFQAAGFDLDNMGIFSVRLTGVSVESRKGEPAYVLAMTSTGTSPSSIHLGISAGSYDSNDVRRMVIPPTRSGNPQTGVLFGWKLSHPVPGAVTLHYRYLGWPMQLRLHPETKLTELSVAGRD